MSFKVVSGFYPSEQRAKAILKKIPRIFSAPRIERARNGSFAVVAGEYDRRDWAEAAMKKLREADLFAGIWLQS